jgi:hypothetical protein
VEFIPTKDIYYTFSEKKQLLKWSASCQFPGSVNQNLHGTEETMMSHLFHLGNSKQNPFTGKCIQTLWKHQQIFNSVIFAPRQNDGVKIKNYPFHFPFQLIQSLLH